MVSLAACEKTPTPHPSAEDRFVSGRVSPSLLWGEGGVRFSTRKQEDLSA